MRGWNPQSPVPITTRLDLPHTSYPLGAQERDLPAGLAVGDLVVIADTGAHGAAMGFQYNGALRAPELLLRASPPSALRGRMPAPWATEVRAAGSVRAVHVVREREDVHCLLDTVHMPPDLERPRGPRFPYAGRGYPYVAPSAWDTPVLAVARGDGSTRAATQAAAPAAATATATATAAATAAAPRCRATPVWDPMTNRWPRVALPSVAAAVGVALLVGCVVGAAGYRAGVAFLQRPQGGGQ